MIHWRPPITQHKWYIAIHQSLGTNDTLSSTNHSPPPSYMLINDSNPITYFLAPELQEVKWQDLIKAHRELQYEWTRKWIISLTHVINCIVQSLFRTSQPFIINPRTFKELELSPFREWAPIPSWARWIQTWIGYTILKYHYVDFADNTENAKRIIRVSYK
jgi:hypothetical protein